MRARLLRLSNDLRGSDWFVPTAMAIGARNTSTTPAFRPSFAAMPTGQSMSDAPRSGPSTRLYQLIAEGTLIRAVISLGMAAMIQPRTISGC